MPFFFLSNGLFSDKMFEYNNLQVSPKFIMEDITELEERLVELECEHKDLDEIIERLRTTPPVDFLQMKRLQKKKLFLKDHIQRLKSDILPDIIA